MQIRPEEITSVLKREIEGFEDHLQMDEVGTVLEVGDGIARELHGQRDDPVR
jgi:F-type H+/Na+-transporting ATPase subunit alpha